MMTLRIWLATNVLRMSNLFLRLATKLTPARHGPDEMFADMAVDCEEHGEAYDAPYYLQHFHRDKGGVVTLRPMARSGEDMEGSE